MLLHHQRGRHCNGDAFGRLKFGQVLALIDRQDKAQSFTMRTPNRSPFSSFMQWSEWLHARTGRTDSIALVRLMTLLFEYLTVELTLPPRIVAEAMWRDYQRGGRSDRPAFLREFLSEAGARLPRRPVAPLKRQARHLAAE